MIIRIETDDVGYWMTKPQNNNEYFCTNGTSDKIK